jgi:glyoxylase-like metal-dependent hydrolase (beta-lactamase superfamily II)
MQNFICITCGTQYAATDQPPARCPICEDERQYITPSGQQWTTLETLRAVHHNVFKPLEPGLTGIGSEPKFAIGQRAVLIETDNGNILWDCITFIDDETVTAIRKMGGISAIAISHPHFYSSMIEWSRAFDNAPIFLHADNKPWVMRPDPVINFWEGETQPLLEGVRLIRCGGHFPGSTVLHWAGGAEGRGLLLTGDTIYIAADQRYVSFMYSYPNLIPLSATAIRRIVAAVEPFAYDRIYSGWFEAVVATEAKAAVRRSAERYIRAINE